MSAHGRPHVEALVALAAGLLLTAPTSGLRAEEATTPLPAPTAGYVPPMGYLPPPGFPAPPYQPPPPARPQTHSDPDRGHVFGGALGFGTFNYYGCGPVCGDAWTGEIHGGGLVTQGLAIEGEVWGGIHGFGAPRFGSGRSLLATWTLALQYWFADIFWVRAGIGVGHLQAIGGSVATALSEQSTIALVLAVGVELHRSYHTAIDLQVRYGSVPFSGRDDDPNPVAALVGLSWR